MFGDIGDGNGEHTLELSEKHKKYIETYKKYGTDIIVILISGRPLVVTDEVAV